MQLTDRDRRGRLFQPAPGGGKAELDAVLLRLKPPFLSQEEQESISALCIAVGERCSQMNRSARCVPHKVSGNGFRRRRLLTDCPRAPFLIGLVGSSKGASISMLSLRLFFGMRLKREPRAIVIKKYAVLQGSTRGEMNIPSFALPDLLQRPCAVWIAKTVIMSG